MSFKTSLRVGGNASPGNFTDAQHCFYPLIELLTLDSQIFPAPYLMFQLLVLIFTNSTI